MSRILRFFQNSSAALDCQHGISNRPHVKRVAFLTSSSRHRKEEGAGASQPSLLLRRF